MYQDLFSLVSDPSETVPEEKELSLWQDEVG
jgi:hypothetical protein